MMIVKDLLTGLLKQDLYDLLIWCEWYFRPSRVSCKICIEEKSRKGRLPDCEKCGLPSARLIKKTFGKKKEQSDVQIK